MLRVHAATVHYKGRSAIQRVSNTSIHKVYIHYNIANLLRNHGSICMFVFANNFSMCGCLQLSLQ